MKSGMLAAEAVAETLFAENEAMEASEAEEVAYGAQPVAYEAALEGSWVHEELKAVRNYKPSFQWGLYAGMAYSGLSAYVLKGREPWTIQHTHVDSECTAKLDDKAAAPISYPKPDGVLSFPLLDNLARAVVDHADQPSHLRVKEEFRDTVLGKNAFSLKTFGGPEANFCPAGVYEYTEDEDGDKELVINAQNCVHCKCCSIKMPFEYINWTVPEGGGGPNYQVT